MKTNLFFKKKNYIHLYDILKVIGLKPSQKNEKINDYPIFVRTSKFKIGYVPQYGGFFHDLTLVDNLKAVSEILIKDPRDRIEKINYLIRSLKIK